MRTGVSHVRGALAGLGQGCPAPLLLATAALAVASLPGDWVVWLRYERTAVQAGQWWRLVSGQLVHLGPAHLWLNLAGLGLVWVLLLRLHPERHAWRDAVVCALGVGLGLYFFSPEIAWYVGLSGVLHGLVAVAAIAALQRDRREALLLVALLGAKLWWEQAHGPLPGSAAAVGGRVVTEAHRYGALAGAALGGYELLRRRGRR
jgi:rhomboid family GlyGly-CTERM serine protease